MFTCNKCGSLYNITKDIKGKQIGGKINVSLDGLFEKLDENVDIDESDLDNITGKDVIEDERFEQRNKNNQKEMMTKIKAVNKSFFSKDKQTADVKNVSYSYFNCRYCSNYEKIIAGTLIYSKEYDTNITTDIVDYSLAVNDPTLSRTRNYICKNKKCVTHKDPSKTEAVITKNTLGQIIYVCTVCVTDWVGAL
jgi:aspartate carbamoyltransferase regulatory subunit